MIRSIASRRSLLFALVLVAVTGGSLSVPVAEQRAVTAEEAYVADRLENASCLDDWGTNEGAANREVAVTNVSPRGVRVTVSLPYAYRTETDGETIYADAASDATYVTSLADTRRIAGDEISPC